VCAEFMCMCVTSCVFCCYRFYNSVRYVLITLWFRNMIELSNWEVTVWSYYQGLVSYLMHRRLASISKYDESQYMTLTLSVWNKTGSLMFEFFAHTLFTCKCMCVCFIPSHANTANICTYLLNKTKIIVITHNNS
jgi:hypothetical protein